MKQLILTEPKNFSLEDVTPPSAPGNGEALVKVHKVGICGTDLHAFQGTQNFFTYPRVLGHELGVEVIEVGARVTGVNAGDRCAVEPYLYSGKCNASKLGKTNCAEDMQVLGVHIDGGMKEYLILPAEKLLPSKTMSYEQLALVEMLGIGAHAVARAQVSDGEWVLVLGAGPIGLATLQFAKAAGAKTIAVDISDQRLAFAQSELGVDAVFSARLDVEASVKTLTGGALPTAVFDATGNQNSMENAFSYVGHGGRLVFVGHTREKLSFDNPEFHKRELTLMASRNATRADLERLMTQIEAGEITTDAWVTHQATMDNFIEKFPTWLQPETAVVKAMLNVSVK